jgi:hypothetical protein
VLARAIALDRLAADPGSLGDEQKKAPDVPGLPVGRMITSRGDLKSSRRSDVSQQIRQGYGNAPRARRLETTGRDLLPVAASGTHATASQWGGS